MEKQAKKAIVLLADGFEDVEAVTPIDYLKRAGIEVTSASISGNLTVTSRWGVIKLITDTTLMDVQKSGIESWDAVILPGGIPGATNLAASEETNRFIKEMAAAGKLVCAICASPVVILAPLGLLDGKKFTCYPGMEDKIPQGKWQDTDVVVDGNILTSRAAGTSGQFAVAIIEKLLDEAAAKKIAEAVLL
ncbi:MAG: DJ-1/PfpI family protein [Treponema sp.]|jgi:4-methyl-5(b-hydroxyethyl)-thiazole monophosphate biosynthesis|nr:DJ-1/PfpI family protein [Treponema sp.]